MPRNHRQLQKVIPVPSNVLMRQCDEYCSLRRSLSRLDTGIAADSMRDCRSATDAMPDRIGGECGVKPRHDRRSEQYSSHWSIQNVDGTG